MPLSKSSPLHLHFLQNASLLIIAIFFTPLSILLAALFSLLSPLTKTYQTIARTQNHIQFAECSQRRVLVTGVGMSKGLFLARCFHVAGHSVVGADFEPGGVYVSGRFSRALRSYYRLVKPTFPSSSSSQEMSNGSAKAYADQILDIVRKENIELWVSCSGVATAVEDGEAAEMVARETACKVVQFGAELTEVLHDKYSFIQNTKAIGLTVPDTKLVTSVAEAVEYLHPNLPDEEEEKESEKSERRSKRYILKPAGMDDSSRADMTLLPFSTASKTMQHLKSFSPSPSRPFVLQQFLTGQEFCTHALVLNGELRAFVACPSADLLMHYHALPAASRLARTLELYTARYVQTMHGNVSGHFSLDFMVDESTFGGFRDENVDSEGIEKGLGNIFPIECNPRAHTAVLLFADQMPDLAEIYLSLLPPVASNSDNISIPPSRLLHASPHSPKVYWLAHDVITKLFLPFLQLLRGRHSAGLFMANVRTFGEHLLYWKDGTLEVWDPWPWCWICVGYWPAMFILALWSALRSGGGGGRWWSRCNVSTNKMFGC